MIKSKKHKKLTKLIVIFMFLLSTVFFGVACNIGANRHPRTLVAFNEAFTTSTNWVLNSSSATYIDGYLMTEMITRIERNGYLMRNVNYTNAQISSMTFVTKEYIFATIFTPGQTIENATWVQALLADVLADEEISSNQIIDPIYLLGFLFAGGGQIYSSYIDEDLMIVSMMDVSYSIRNGVLEFSYELRANTAPQNYIKANGTISLNTSTAYIPQHVLDNAVRR